MRTLSDGQLIAIAKRAQTIADKAVTEHPIGSKIYSNEVRAAIVKASILVLAQQEQHSPLETT